MPHRDPETGQFVSGQGGGSYRDFSVTNIGAQWQVPASELPGAFPINATFSLGDAVQDLHHDQLARLVQGQVQMQATVPGTLSAESTLLSVMELSIDADPAVAGENLEQTEETDVVGQFNRKFAVNVDEPDVIALQTEVNEGSFRDTTTGTGGGADAKTPSITRVYPGGGPEVDRRDNLYLHVAADDFQAAAIADSAIAVGITALLYWRMFDK